MLYYVLELIIQVSFNWNFVENKTRFHSEIWTFFPFQDHGSSIAISCITSSSEWIWFFKWEHKLIYHRFRPISQHVVIIRHRFQLTKNKQSELKKSKTIACHLIGSFIRLFEKKKNRNGARKIKFIISYRRLVCNLKCNIFFSLHDRQRSKTFNKHKFLFC